MMWQNTLEVIVVLSLESAHPACVLERPGARNTENRKSLIGRASKTGSTRKHCASVMRDLKTCAEKIGGNIEKNEGQF